MIQSVDSGSPVVGVSGASGWTPDRSLDKQAFLELLTIELKYQNPLEPMTNAEFLGQLAQFSSLEQMQGIKESLDMTTLLQQSMNNAMATSLLGKEVRGLGSTFSFDGSSEAVLAFEIPSSAAATVQILDASGFLVGTVSAGALSAGAHEVTWDGNADSGQKAPPGEYYFRVLAFDQHGAEVPSTTFVQGTVTGVSFRDGTAVLLLDQTQLSISQILEVF